MTLGRNSFWPERDDLYINDIGLGLRSQRRLGVVLGPAPPMGGAPADSETSFYKLQSTATTTEKFKVLYSVLRYVLCST